jgi:hypothetical protein
LDRSEIKYIIDFDYFQTITNKYPELLTKGLYASSVESYIDKFGVENVLITTKEEIDENPLSVVEKLYSFLGVNTDFKPSILDKNVSKGIVPRFYLFEKFRVNFFRFSKKYFPRLILVFRKYRIGELYRKINEDKEEIRLTPDVYNHLVKFYTDDVEKITSKLNINTNNWLKNE